MAYASERQKEKWNHNKMVRTERVRHEFNTREELKNRCEQNKRILNLIWNEIIEVCVNIRQTTDRNSKAILQNRYRYLSNKYCFCNPLDEIISYK